MNEQERLKDVHKYNLLGESIQKELDELIEIASAIFDTPMSLVTFIDKKNQLIKAKKGCSVSKTKREDSFCQYALKESEKVLVVENPLTDVRFKNNPFVLGEPNIRFYAGAPLKTPKGNVVGTICVIDSIPHEISENQEKALMLLAKKAIEYLENKSLIQEQRNTIEFNISKLKKLTDMAPGAIYQFEMKSDGSMSFPFISSGFTDIHPSLKPEDIKKKPEIAFESIHPDDVNSVKESIQESFKNLTTWNMEYRVLGKDGKIVWHWANANPEKKEDGTVVWFGSFQDITEKKEYMNTLEQILFDISHVMRRPISTMMGLTDNFKIDELDEENLEEYINYLKTVYNEMDLFTKNLNEKYYEIKMNLSDFNKTK